MALSPDKASIGRIVWYWRGTEDVRNGVEPAVIDPEQACVGQVIFVHSDNSVDLLVTDHIGVGNLVQNVELHDPDPNPPANGGDGHDMVDTGYATWMPYQKKKHTEEKQTALPTRNQLAGLLAATHYGQYSSREEELELNSRIAVALKNYDISTGKFEEKEKGA